MSASFKIWYEEVDSKLIEGERFNFSDGFSSDINTYLVSFSRDYVNFVMELSTSPSSSLWEEVLSLDSLCLGDEWMESF